VTACALPDHQLSEAGSHGPTDQGVAFQHIDCPDNVFDARSRVHNLVLKEMLEDAVDVVCDPRRQFDARHD
ncbi:MAG: hypothetical protein ACRET7_11455, partial [Burkholderiales bacterium]